MFEHDDNLVTLQRLQNERLTELEHVPELPRYCSKGGLYSYRQLKARNQGFNKQIRQIQIDCDAWQSDNQRGKG